MKPMCAAVKVGLVCAGLLVGIGANADWQFSRHNNDAGQMTCSAILNQGHTFDATMSPPQRLDLPRGTLELFTDEVTQRVRMANGDEYSKPVIAFHWLYPVDAAKYADISTSHTHHLWDPRSDPQSPTIQTDLTRRWGINYQVRHAGVVVASGSWNATSGADATATEGPWVERLGDVVANADNTLSLVDIGYRTNHQYMSGGAPSNSSFWWDVPTDVLNYLTGSMDVTLRVDFHGHSGFNSSDRHPVSAQWDVSGGDRAAAFLNRGMCNF